MTATETGQRPNIKIDAREDFLGTGILEHLVQEGRVPFAWDVKGIGVYFHGLGWTEKAVVFIVPPSGTRIGDGYKRDGYSYEFFDRSGQSLGNATSVNVRGLDVTVISKRIDKALEEIEIRKRRPSLRDRLVGRMVRPYRDISEAA